jgi:hypothetical protein
MTGDAGGGNSKKKYLRLQEMSTHWNSPKYSFSGPPSTKEKPETAPGPGRYGCPSLKEKYRSTPNISFGTSVRALEKKYKDGATGPGQYSAKDPYATSPMFGFGTASRLPQAKVRQSPDPGAYKTSPGLATRDISFAGKMPGKIIKSKMPGPGQYQSGLDKGYKAVHEKDADVSFGTSQRADMHKKGDAPPPGTYKVAVDLGKDLQTSQSCPNFSFYSRRRPIRSDATPGPIYPHYTQFG